MQLGFSIKSLGNPWHPATLFSNIPQSTETRHIIVVNKILAILTAISRSKPITYKLLWMQTLACSGTHETICCYHKTLLRDREEGEGTATICSLSPAFLAEPTPTLSPKVTFQTTMVNSHNPGSTESPATTPPDEPTQWTNPSIHHLQPTDENSSAGWRRCAYYSVVFVLKLLKLFWGIKVTWANWQSRNNTHLRFCV